MVYKELAKQVEKAESRIRPYIRKTILEHSPYLSEYGANVYCKLENLQNSGSFKVRGALSKMLSLSEDDLKKGIVTASTGNHGAGVAYGLKNLDAKGIVFVPEIIPAVKMENLVRQGVQVEYHGDDCIVAEKRAREFASQNNMTYLPPYNDLEVVAGQGTIGVELAEQLEQIDTVFVALGGGGLISGIAGYLKSKSPKIKIIGCSPENSQVMIQSVAAGKILDLPSLPTLSDSTAGGVEAGSITFEFCRSLVDEYVTVTENEIKESLLSFVHNHHMLIEGAAAVPIASFLKKRNEYKGKNVVIIICGANISLDTLRNIL